MNPIIKDGEVVLDAKISVLRTVESARNKFNNIVPAIERALSAATSPEAKKRLRKALQSSKKIENDLDEAVFSQELDTD